MSDSTDRTSVVLGRVSIAAITLVIAGLVLFLLGIVLDWGGFVGGLGLGAGVALGLVGAYLWGYGNGIRRGGVRASWLPSQETGR
ncbi:hypothetical protein QL996_01480 [Planococcus sp. APC 4015]|nr:hypothetical protein [Planococcus sp. APC 4015]